MSPLDIEIRKLDLNTVLKLSDILDKNNSWKQLMAIIPADLETDDGSEVKYSWEDVQLVEQAKEQQQRPGTSILIEEWGTSGKIRPRLSTLRQLLVKAELFRAADYISELLKVPPPERPQKGPAAQVEIPKSNQLPVINVKPIPSSLPSFLHHTPPTSPCPQEVLFTQISPLASQSCNLVEEGEEESFQNRPTILCPDVQSLDFPSYQNEAVNISYRKLVEATNNFNNENCLGKGACGTVYLGVANPENRKLAIKRLHKEGVPGGADKQFNGEIKAISKISHPNLLTLLGFSTDGDALCLVYPFMPKGSLCEMLATEENKCKLDWRLRLNISLGIANGIAHLHSLLPKPLIHRDIKTANVLLDENMIPKLCDFGLVRASSDDRLQSTALTTTIIGTSAYMASEAFRGEISIKMDVFSFGVVLLELLTGLPASDDDNGPLVDTIFDKRIDNSQSSEFLMDDLVDITAGDWGGDLRNGIANQFLNIALDCIDEKNRRPYITAVVQRLSNIISRLS